MTNLSKKISRKHKLAYFFTEGLTGSITKLLSDFSGNDDIPCELSLLSDVKLKKNIIK